MNKLVWVVSGVDSHYEDIIAIFDTEEKAIEFKDSDAEPLDGYAFISINSWELK